MQDDKHAMTVAAGGKRDFNQVFVTGRMRSGTTLMRSLLNAHSKICIPPESTFIWDLYPIYGKRRKWSVSVIQRFLRDLDSDVKFKFWHVDDAYLVNMLVKLGPDTTYQQVCQTVLASYEKDRDLNDIMWTGDKNPVYTHYLDDLLHIFPNAKFVHLIRDYRDVLASLWPLEFETQWSSAMSYRWNKCQKSYMCMKKKFPNNFFLLRYEDLINNPQKEISSVLQFLGLQWEDDVLQFYIHNSQISKKMPEKLKQYIQNTDRPILHKNAGKWRTTLSKRQIAVAEAISGDIGKIFGYEPSLGNHYTPTGGIVARVYSQLYFKVEKFSALLPPALKRIYLMLKRRFEHRWYQRLMAASKDL